MKKICCIAEGYGDVDALPSLIAKTGAIEDRIIISPEPIRAGEWPKVKRAGVLERLLDLASSRNWDHILMVLDLDDGCPVEEHAHAMERVNTWLNGRDILVSVVFLNREYETLFLQEPSCLGDVETQMIPNDPTTIRGAKGLVKRLIGRRYKETTDQKEITERLDLVSLEISSRSFRKLKKEILRNS